MVDVPGDVLRPPHCTTPAAVKANKNAKISSFKSNDFMTSPGCDLRSFETIIDLRQGSSQSWRKSYQQYTAFLILFADMAYMTIEQSLLSCY